MTSAKSVKATKPIAIDPNFFLPPNVVDMRYVREDEVGETATVRDDDGVVVGVQYDEVNPSEFGGEIVADTGTVSTVLSPPDTVTVVSQQVRITADGKFVVDVILEVDDIPGVTNYDVRVTKTT